MSPSADSSCTASQPALGARRLQVPEQLRRPRVERAEAVAAGLLRQRARQEAPLYELLESRGIEAVLVNARQLHHVPGRKTDMRDCQ